jgi:hypothetical protein
MLIAPTSSEATRIVFIAGELAIAHLMMDLILRGPPKRIFRFKSGLFCY